ncbi:MAG: disulfide bond formation protein DsbB [Candidatus Thiodiazotropha taylori]|nr:disulfide bond formation protein DsbB [Candidatus Thiodiazotropha taylori]MCG8079743.1 disulfide bond formation protein DsbB [Candidatus Thiodiazotropha taylori]MCG8108389.1 disulfide bond formation protein DsbB [Candidatus Thiodiazotropha taylori]MCW4280728.1 disulfide bond formation protein DsbB [Candidatus Thiodiazotropha taylori]MCW4306505.1 disulfide bond formation protein DsbB [Candidatus Thiodiazotropha taylori]
MHKSEAVMTHHRTLSWLVLAATTLTLELAALYFQHVMSLEPCVLCIYQRVAVGILFTAFLFGAIAPHISILRWFSYLIWSAGALWGLYLAFKQSGLQLGIIPPSMSCDVNAKFPEWLKLDEWFPAIFQPSGFCDDVQWQFIGLSMAQWMIVIMSGYLLLLSLYIYLDIRARISSS